MWYYTFPMSFFLSLRTLCAWEWNRSHYLICKTFLSQKKTVNITTEAKISLIKETTMSQDRIWSHCQFHGHKKECIFSHWKSAYSAICIHTNIYLIISYTPRHAHYTCTLIHAVYTDAYTHITHIHSFIKLLLNQVWWGLPRCVSGKEFICQCRRHKRCRFDPWVVKIPWRREW